MVDCVIRFDYIIHLIPQVGPIIIVKGEQKKNLPKFFYNNSVKFYSDSKILDIFE